MTSPRRLIAIGAAVLVGMGLLAGCGGHSAAPAPNDFDQPTTTTTDPYAVPTVIDAAYVERVLNALEDVRADVRRDVVANHRFTQESRDKLAETVQGDALKIELQVFNDASMAPTPANTRQPPGSSRYMVERIRSASSTCIEANVTVDSSAVVTDAPERSAIRIVTLDATSARGRWNPTVWRKRLEQVGTEPPAGFACA